jgi:hypothetical protein
VKCLSSLSAILPLRLSLKYQLADITASQAAGAVGDAASCAQALGLLD